MVKPSSKYDNELIRKRRRKKRIRNIVLLFMFMSSILITLCLKLPYFNVQHINVLNNKNVSKEEIIKLSTIINGNNIFYINSKKSVNGILSNPYILSVDIKRKYPNTINIYVKEREAAFYSLKDNKYVIIDKEGICLEIRENVANMNLVKLEGIGTSDITVGKAVKVDDNKKIKIINEISSLLYRNISECIPSMVDITNILDIKIYFGNMCVKLGNYDNIEKKLNTGLNILISQDLKKTTGYIDVSFDGPPVFYKQK